MMIRLPKPRTPLPLYMTLPSAAATTGAPSEPEMSMPLVAVVKVCVTGPLAGQPHEIRLASSARLGMTTVLAGGVVAVAGGVVPVAGGVAGVAGGVSPEPAGGVAPLASPMGTGVATAGPVEGGVPAAVVPALRLDD